MPRYPAGQTAGVCGSFLETIAESERDDRRPHAEIDARRGAGKGCPRFAFDRHITRVREQVPAAAEVEFEAAVEDEAARVLEMDSGRGRSEALVNVSEYRVHDAHADVRPDRPMFQQVPLHHSGDRIDLRPAEIGGRNEIASHDSDSRLRLERGHFRLERKAVADKEIESTADAAPVLERRLESRAGRGIRRFSGALH